MNSYGMSDLAVLAAWREMVHARDFCSRKGRKGFQLDNRLSEKNNKANLIY